MSEAARLVLAPWADRLTRPVDVIADDLERFRQLLEKWQAAQNLVSRETLDAFWTRHIADSLQVLPFVLVDVGRVFDLGSGGGFPGVPLALARKGSGTRFFFCEANTRKLAFLRTLIREFKPDAKVIGGRIEAIDSRETEPADLVVSRALAPLNRLLELAFPLLAPNGRLVLHKGRENQKEIDAAGASWRFDVVRHLNATDKDGVLLEISALARRSQ